mgnify:CR=1 FL=1
MRSTDTTPHAQDGAYNPSDPKPYLSPDREAFFTAAAALVDRLDALIDPLRDHAAGSPLGEDRRAEFDRLAAEIEGLASPALFAGHRVLLAGADLAAWHDMCTPPRYPTDSQLAMQRAMLATIEEMERAGHTRAAVSAAITTIARAEFSKQAAETDRAPR